jgi:hypothetical protein
MEMGLGDCTSSNFAIDSKIIIPSMFFITTCAKLTPTKLKEEFFS